MSKKILVVEDETVLQDIYRTKLNIEGYIAFIAATGEEGMAMAVNEKPDLIVLDVILPGGADGFVILKKLKENESTKNIPVIMATNIDNQVVKAIDAGAVWYFVKAQTPIDTIVKKIEEILK